MKIPLYIDASGMSHDKVARLLGQVVETMVFRAMQFLDDNPSVASIYQSGVTYDRGQGDWLDIPKTLAWGKGSCRELVPWRLAELRRSGVQAMVQVYVFDDVSDLFHLEVLYPNSQVEDPSRILGMADFRQVEDPSRILGMADFRQTRRL